MKNDYLKHVKSIIGVTTSEAEDYIKWMEKFKGLEMNSAHDIISHKDGFEGMTPNVIETNPKNIAVLDVFSRLMMDRIIFMGHAIDSQVANIVLSQLLYLEKLDKTKDVNMYVNSPGGSVYDGLSVYSTMQEIDCDVSTITTGMAASMGYVLAIAGTKEKRFALPYSRLMQHQPLGGARGQATDIENTNREIQKLKFELYEIIAYHTGQSIETIFHDCERDHWMRAEEAKKYGAIDHVIRKKSGLEPSPLSEEAWKVWSGRN